MADKKNAEWLLIAIGSVVLLATFSAVLLVNFGFVMVPAGTTQVAYTGGIDFTSNPVATPTRNPDGSYTAEVEVSKSDQWHWDELEVEATIVSSEDKRQLIEDTKVRLVSELPRAPVTEHFVLRFQIDRLDSESVELRGNLKVKASKHFCFFGGTKSQTKIISLQPSQFPVPR